MFKGQRRDTRVIEGLGESDFFEFIVDSFEYNKRGLDVSHVRDIQVLMVGDLLQLWKQNLLKHSKVGGILLNFI